MRGRKPKPTSLKIAEGNPGKRKLPANEPRPDVTSPACPYHLQGAARVLWDDLVPQLARLGVMTAIDTTAMSCLCEAWELYLKACEKVRSEGEVIVTDKGNLVQSPWVSIKNTQSEIVRKLSAEFGLTPSSRARVDAKVADKPEEDLKAFLKIA